MPVTPEVYRYPALKYIARFIPEGVAVSVLLFLLGEKIEVVLENADTTVIESGPAVEAITTHLGHEDTLRALSALYQLRRKKVYPIAKGETWKKPGQIDLLTVIAPAGAYFTLTCEEKENGAHSTFRDELYDNVRPKKADLFRRIKEGILNPEANQGEIFKQSDHTTLVYPKGSRKEKAHNEKGIFEAVASLFIGTGERKSIEVPIQPISIQHTEPIFTDEIEKKKVTALIREGIVRSLTGRRETIKVTVHTAIYPSQEIMNIPSDSTEDPVIALGQQLQRRFEKYDPRMMSQQ